MGTVIKAERTAELRGNLSRVDWTDYLQEARAVLDQARAQAENAPDQVRKDKERLHEEARRQGRREGFERGRREGLKQGREEAFQQALAEFRDRQGSLVESLRRVTEGFEAEKSNLMRQARRDVLKFAVDLAGQLTFRVGELHHEAAQANLERALKRLAEATDVKIYVHPQDLKTIQTFAPSLMKHQERLRTVNVIEDDSLAPGGVRLGGGSAVIDADLKTQIDQMTSILLGAPEPGPSEPAVESPEPDPSGPAGESVES